MSDKPVHVKAHTRPRNAEETFLEFPSVAPVEGVKIIDAHNKPDAKKGIERGVKRVGGGDHGKAEKGVKRLGY